MNKFLRIFLTVFVILLSASVITECSCGKKAGGDNGGNNNTANNTDSGNGDGHGDGGDGGDGGNKPPPPPKPEIVLINIDDSVAELKGDTIELKASGFPRIAADNTVFATDLFDLTNAPAGSLKRAFDITIKGANGVNATGGFLFTGRSDLFYPTIRHFTLPAISTTISSYTDVYLSRAFAPIAPLATTTTFNPDVVKVGWNMYGLFMDHFVSSGSFGMITRGLPTRPIFFCRTTISTITSGADAGAGTAQDDTVLKGGEKASCYVGAVGNAFIKEYAKNWLDTPAFLNFRKIFLMGVGGIKTDDKTIGNIGLSGGAAELRNGLIATEIDQLTAANEHAYGKFSVTLVKDSGFTYTTPKIVFQNFDGTTAKLVAGTGGGLDTLKIKATQFPATAATSAGGNIGDLHTAPAERLKKIFEITIAGGDAPGNASGGVIMVGTGSINSLDDFADQTTGTDNEGTAAVRKEGYSTGIARGIASANGIFPAGWEHRGIFMNDATPTSSDANTSPFAFTQTSTGSEPFIFCTATIPSITTDQPALNGGIKATTTFEGGETAHCYIGSKGVAFSHSQANDWLATAASGTFKKTFNIAVGGIRTDGKTVSQFMPGANDIAKINALNDGLSDADVAALAAANTGAYKKVAVTIVSDTDF